MLKYISIILLLLTSCLVKKEEVRDENPKVDSISITKKLIKELDKNTIEVIDSIYYQASKHKWYKYYKNMIAVVNYLSDTSDIGVLIYPNYFAEDKNVINDYFQKIKYVYPYKELIICMDSITMQKLHLFKDTGDSIVFYSYITNAALIESIEAYNLKNLNESLIFEKH